MYTRAGRFLPTERRRKRVRFNKIPDLHIKFKPASIHFRVRTRTCLVSYYPICDKFVLSARNKVKNTGSQFH